MPVRHIDDLEEVTAIDIKIGVITVPAQNAQDVVNYAVSKGIKGFLNFAPVRIKPPGVRIQNSDVTSDLQELFTCKGSGYTFPDQIGLYNRSKSSTTICLKPASGCTQTILPPLLSLCYAMFGLSFGLSIG